MTDQIQERQEVVEAQVPAIVHVATEMAVVSQETYESAALFIQEHIKPMRSQVNEVFDPIIAHAHKAHREAIAQKKKFTDPLDKAESHVKGLMGTYYRQQEEERRRREQELQRLAREREETERLEQAAELSSGARPKRRTR